jgi:hypothetical protein
MSKHPTSGSSDNLRTVSRWAGWALGLLAAPVLYVLTAPPIVWGLDTRWGTRTHVGVPDWMDSYLVPFRWLYQREMLKPLLEPYSHWWRFFFLARTQRHYEKSGGSPFMSR